MLSICNNHWFTGLVNASVIITKIVSYNAKIDEAGTEGCVHVCYIISLLLLYVCMFVCACTHINIHLQHAHLQHRQNGQNPYLFSTHIGTHTNGVGVGNTMASFNCCRNQLQTNCDNQLQTCKNQLEPTWACFTDKECRTQKNFCVPLLFIPSFSVLSFST